ncbi:MAG: hypothetical protein LLG04_08220 [Parachlamydia sp.]|nr:hypothetical protein [Parachlamydia sp.]
MSFEDVIRGAAKPAASVPAAASPVVSSPGAWPEARGRSWGAAAARKVSLPPEPLPFDPHIDSLAPAASAQEVKAKTNKKGILADVANIGQDIDKDFTTYQNLLKEQEPQLTGLKWRAEVFLQLLKALMQKGHLRTPAIRAEYDEIVKQYENIHLRRTGLLTSHVRHYLAEWVCPIAATASSAASRVHFICAIQGKLKTRADVHYADYLSFRQRLAALQADLDRVWTLIEEIDGVIERFNSKELPCDRKRFVTSVEADQERLLARVNQKERDAFIVLLRNADQPCVLAEAHMLKLCGWGARLNQWLQLPEMPPETGKQSKDGVIRNGSVESLKRVAEVYKSEKLADLGANLQDLVGPVSKTREKFQEIIEKGLAVLQEKGQEVEEINPEINAWAQGAAEEVINYLDNVVTRFQEASRIFYDLKAKASARYEALIRSVEARKGESYAPPVTISLRDTIELSMQKQSAKGGSWWFLSYLSAPFAWRRSPKPVIAEEGSVGFDILENRLKALNWVKARQVSLQCSLEPILANEVTRQTLLPPEQFRRDLGKIQPADWKPEDYWLKAVNFLPQARALIQQTQEYNNRGAHLVATHHLLKRLMEQLQAKHVAPELEKLKPLIAPLIAHSIGQLLQDGEEHQKTEKVIDQSVNQALSALDDYLKKLRLGLLGSLPFPAISQVIQELELLQVILKKQQMMTKQTHEIQEKWIGAKGQFFYSSEDPFAEKPAAVKPASGHLAVIALVPRQEEKPEGLGKRLQECKCTQEPEQFLLKIGERLPKLIEVARHWETEKLSYHDSAFKRVCSAIQRMEYQMEQLFANVQHLEQAALALKLLYTDPKPLTNKDTPLVKQLELLKTFQAQLAKDAAICKEQLPLSIELLNKMATEESLKLTAEKVNWRRQQEEYLTRTPAGNQRRREQLKRSEGMCRFAVIRLQLLWNIAEEAYQQAEKHVEVLNYLQNAIPGKWYGYYPPAPLHVNPLMPAGQAEAKDAAESKV